MNDERRFIHPYHDRSGRWEEVAELYDGGYDWGIAAVWRDTTTGRLYGDTDSGCSCYGPFEEPGHGAGTFGDLIEITSRDQASALAERVYGEEGVSTTDRLDFVREVEIALNILSKADSH